jgi:capsular exopolysaccharide synthesis family protein
MTDTPIDGAEPQSPPAAPPRNLLSALWQRKALILFGLAVGTLVGVLVYLQRPSVYQSSAQVHVTKKRSELISGPDGMGLAYEDFIPTHLVLIRSPKIVQKAVAILKEMNGERQEEGELPPLSVLVGQSDAGVIGTIRGGLSAAREGNDPTAASTGIINLSYRGPVAEECPIILDAVIEAYEEYLSEVSKNTAEEAYKEVTEARKALDKELNEKEKLRLDRRDKGPLIWGERDSGTFYLAQLTALNTKLVAIPLQKTDIKDRLKAIEAARAKGVVTERLLSPLGGRDRPTITERSLEEALLPLLQQEQTLQEDYGPDHPKLKTVRRQVAMTRELYQRRALLPAGGGPNLDDPVPADLVDGFVRFLEWDLKDLEETEKSLKALFKQEEEKAREVLKHFHQDEALSSEIRRKQQNFDLASQRLSDFRVAKDNDSGGYRSSVISPPEGAGKVAPSLSQVLSIWVFLGLLGGVGLAYLAEVTDKSFRTPEEIRRRLGLPIVGHIPYTARAATNGDGAAAAGHLDASLLAYHQPSALEAEAYKSLRTSLYFSTRGERHKVIQITSPNMGDGKSTLAANLAICIAQSGKTVVLVDADCRRPRLHRLFGLRGELGLTSVIVGECGPQEAVRPTEVPHLSVLPCGPRPTNPAELLTSPKFEELLNELRGQYDFVLVDSPPLLAVTDPCVVAARADGVLLTIRVSKNGRPAAERAKELLTGMGANVLGVVVNGIGKEAVAYGYGYRHYRYDQYGYEYRGRDEEADPVVKAEKNGTAAPADGAAPRC